MFQNRICKSKVWPSVLPPRFTGWNRQEHVDGFFLVLPLYFISNYRAPQHPEPKDRFCVRAAVAQFHSPFFFCKTRKHLHEYCFLIHNKLLQCFSSNSQEICHLLWQVLPFPVKPSLHLHVYDPSVLLHTALLSQLWTPVEHSLTSD